MESVSDSRSQRSSAISPCRSQKSPFPPLPVNRQAGPPATPPAASSLPPSKLSISLVTSASPTPSPAASSLPPSKLSISLVTSASPTPSPSTLALEGHDASKAEENLTVTVRIRPLSGREINKGGEISWYLDGDHTVKNESNPSISYEFDKVSGPATTSHHVYDAAAHHVINGAMQGINGTVFEYSVTISGKTHTMHASSKLNIQLNEKIFKLEIEAANNRILQDQPRTKIAENVEMQDTIFLQRQQLNSLLDKCSSKSQRTDDIDAFELLHSQVLMQAAEIENLSQEKARLIEERDRLQVKNSKLAEGASQVKELAMTRANALQNLAKEITKFSHTNAKLISDQAARPYRTPTIGELQRELNVRYRIEAASEKALFEREQIEIELQRILNEAKQREEDFEKERANMVATVVQMRKSCVNADDIPTVEVQSGVGERNLPSHKMKNGDDEAEDSGKYEAVGGSPKMKDGDDEAEDSDKV